MQTLTATNRTRQILGDRCGAVDCHAAADRTVVWGTTDGHLVEVTYECPQHAAESATVPGLLPGAQVAAVFAGLRDIAL